MWLDLLSPARMGAQYFQRPSVTVRVGSSLHVAGLERSLKPELRQGTGASWQHQVEPSTAIGATVAAAYGRGLLGVRVDGDLVRRAEIRRDPAGPRLINPASGKSYWMTGSAWIAPRFLCGRRCVQLSAGVGRGFYDYAVLELRGDIANAVAPAQHITAGRVGVDVRLPFLGRFFVVQVADHFGRLTHGYSEGELLSPIHTVVVALGARMGS